MRGGSQVRWVEAEHWVRGRAPQPWIAQPLPGQPSPCPAHSIPGFWTDVRGFRLLTLWAGWDSGRCWKESLAPAPGPLQSPPTTPARPAWAHPSPRQVPSVPCQLCGSPRQPLVPAPAHQAPLLGEGQESGIPSLQWQGSWAQDHRKTGRLQQKGSGRLQTAASGKPDLTSLGSAIRVLDPRNSGQLGRVLWEMSRGVRGGLLVPPTAQSPDLHHLSPSSVGMTSLALGPSLQPSLLPSGLSESHPAGKRDSQGSHSLGTNTFSPLL